MFEVILDYTVFEGSMGYMGEIATKKFRRKHWNLGKKTFVRIFFFLGFFPLWWHFNCILIKLFLFLKIETITNTEASL